MIKFDNVVIVLFFIDCFIKLNSSVIISICDSMMVILNFELNISILIEYGLSKLGDIKIQQIRSDKGLFNTNDYK